MISTPIPHTNIKNGQPPLDNTRPFMDDTGRLGDDQATGRTGIALASGRIIPGSRHQFLTAEGLQRVSVGRWMFHVAPRCSW